MQHRRDYSYHLPEELIAQVPADQRDRSRLLQVGAAALADRRFDDIAELLPAEAVLVVNDVRVLPARLRGTKESGGAVELLLLEPTQPAGGPERWRAMARASKPMRPGARVDLDGATAVVVEGRGEDGTLVVELSEPALELVERAGDLPLPPYIARPQGATAADRERYQTVYARVPGAVAAPTAGLHFTTPLLDRVRARGCAIAPLTLRVGIGTFAPMRAEHLDGHRMHREHYDIPEDTAALVASGRPVVAVGTTVVRALESAACGEHRVAPGPGSTDLFIRPGYRFQVVDHLITNFHLPESTLLMLVCAFGGYHRVMDAYRHAVAERYRFFSYGDAMLLAREDA